MNMDGEKIIIWDENAARKQFTIIFHFLFGILYAYYWICSEYRTIGHST